MPCISPAVLEIVGMCVGQRTRADMRLASRRRGRFAGGDQCLLGICFWFRSGCAANSPFLCLLPRSLSLVCALLVAVAPFLPRRKAPLRNVGMVRHGPTTGFDPFLSKESLDSLARMGFGKRRPRLGPHRYHGIAARTRLSVAGKVKLSAIYYNQLKL